MGAVLISLAFAFGAGLLWAARVRAQGRIPVLEAVPQCAIEELEAGRFRVLGRIVPLETSPSVIDGAACVFLEHAEYRVLGSSLVPLMKEVEHCLVAHLAVFLACTAISSTAYADGWTQRLSGPALATELTSGDANVRRQAAEALGLRGANDPAVRALMTALTTERSPAVRRALIRSLARRGDPEAVPVLVASWRTMDDIEREDAARALGELGTPEAIDSLVAALLESPLVPAATAGLARAGDRAIPALVAGLGPSPWPRVLALLGQTGNPLLVPRILPYLTAESGAVRVAALDALAALGDSRAAAPAAEVALRDEDPAVLSAALRCLGVLAGPDQVSTLEEMLGGLEANDLHFGFRALLRADIDAGVAALTSAITSDEPARVQSAADVALEAPEPELAAVLFGLVREGTRGGEAVGALADLPGGAGAPVLLAEAQREGSSGRHALRGLAICLRRWSASLPSAVRREALATLRRSAPPVLRSLARDPRVGPELVASLSSAAPEERAQAAFGLELLGDRRYAAALAEPLASESEPEAFRRLAVASARLGTDIHVDSLWRSVANPATAPEALAVIASASGLSPRHRRRWGELARGALRDGQARVRAGAARALALGGERRAWRAVAGLLEDRHPEVRLAAARALATLGAPASRSLLAGAARVETSEEVRAVLIDAVAVLDGRRAVPFDATGDEVLRVRVVTTGARGSGAQRSDPVPVDVVLPSGRWLRMSSLDGGDVLLPDLPRGVADVRVRLGT